MKTSKLIHLLTLMIWVLLAGCVKYNGKVIKDTKNTPYWSKWKYLSECRGSVTLPALFDNKTKRLQSCCITGTGKLHTVDARLYVEESAIDLKKVVNSVKSSLASIMGNSLDNSNRWQIHDIPSYLSTWHSVVCGLNYSFIKPDSIALEFNSDICYTPDSSWIYGGREIAVGVVFIDSLIFLSEDKVESNLDTLLFSSFRGGDITDSTGLTFSMIKKKRGYYRICVKNIYYSVKTISTYMKEIKIVYDTINENRKYSFERLNFSVNESKNDSMIYYYHIDPPQERKRYYCGGIGKNRTFTINDNCLGIIKPNRMEYGLKVELTLLFFGIKPDQIIGFSQ